MHGTHRPERGNFRPPSGLSAMAAALCDMTFPLPDGARPCEQLLASFLPTARLVNGWLARQREVNSTAVVFGAMLGLIAGAALATVIEIILHGPR